MPGALGIPAHRRLDADQAHEPVGALAHLSRLDRKPGRLTGGRVRGRPPAHAVVEPRTEAQELRQRARSAESAGLVHRPRQEPIGALVSLEPDQRQHQRRDEVRQPDRRFTVDQRGRAGQELLRPRLAAKDERVPKQGGRGQGHLAAGALRCRGGHASCPLRLRERPGHEAGSGRLDEHLRRPLRIRRLDPPGLGRQEPVRRHRRPLPHLGSPPQPVDVGGDELVARQDERLVEQQHGRIEVAPDLAVGRRQEQPPGPLLRRWGEPGRALECARGDRVGAAQAGAERRLLERRGDVLVRRRRRRGQMPRAPCRICRCHQLRGEDAMGRPPLGGRRRPVDGLPHQRMPEPDRCRLGNEDAGGDGAIESVRADVERRARRLDRVSFRRVARAREHEGAADVARQPGDLRAVDALDAPGRERECQRLHPREL